MNSTLKFAHVGLVAASGLGFVLRFALIQADAAAVRWRHFRTAPHVVDALLLASGVLLALSAHIDPRTNPWLAAKLVALFVYIVAGAFALRGAPRFRPFAFGLAVVVFGYMISVALTRQPHGFFAGAFR